MKIHYTLVLVHKELDRDNTYIQFKGSNYQAKKAFFAMTFALVSSPFCKILLLAGDKIVQQAVLKGEFYVLQV